MPVIDVPVAVLGPGAVGRSLLAQLVAGRAAHRARLGLGLAVVAVADTTGVVAGGGAGGWAGGGTGVAGGRAAAGAGGSAGEPAHDVGAWALGDDVLVEIAAHKAAGRPLAAFPGAVAERFGPAWFDRPAAGGPPPILVDCTAGDTSALLVAARAIGWSIVLANKVPLTGPMATFERLTQGGIGARWETTVAAALPVIATLQGLVDRGDAVHRISGAISGTLGYVCRRLSDGAPLSAAVAEAGELGYLEPDPRVDLSGLDAARKALILARMLGRPLELADVDVQGLYPADWDDLDGDAFLRRLPELDAAWARRAGHIAGRGQCLRYIASIDAQGVRVGPAPVDPSAREARVDATDSILVFETDCFRANPLVVSGRGGGPAVTASGVLGDIVSLARAAVEAARRDGAGAAWRDQGAPTGAAAADTPPRVASTTGMAPDLPPSLRSDPPPGSPASTA